jgi:PAS domain-containing protein
VTTRASQDKVGTTLPSGEHDWAEQVRRLESEVAGLRRSMRTRGLIEQAKGIVAERLGVDPEEAFAYLSRVSQRTNTRLIDVAADMVGTVRPAPQRQPANGAAGDPLPVVGDLPTPYARRLRRFGAMASAATTQAELAQAVAGEAVEWLGATAVAIFGPEPSGGQRLLSASGWPAQVVSDWQRTPSAVATPSMHVAQLGHPIWIDDTASDSPRHAYTLMGTARRRAVLPLTLAGCTTGALEIAWDEAAPFSDTEQRYLVAVAAAVARRLDGLATTTDTPPAGQWLEAIVDAALMPAQLLTPVRDSSGAVRDFVIDYANHAEASDHPGWRLGRRLLDTDPDLVTSGVFDAYVGAYAGNGPVDVARTGDRTADGRRVLRRRATRLGERLLVTWQPARSHVDGEDLNTRMEALGGFGWGEWSDTLQPLVWSPGLFQLLGREEARGAIGLDRVLGRTVASDLPMAEAMVRRVIEECREAAVEIRLDRDGDLRHLRISAEPRLDHDGRPAGILAVLQDVTDTRRREAQLSRREEQLAAQRIHNAAEQAQTDELRRLLYPPAEHVHVDGRLTLLARHVAPASIHRFRGDFYDIVDAPVGVVLTLGDVFGGGVVAATTMMRLRHAARALSLAGLEPAHVLALLNGELHRDADPPLASLVVARFSDGALSWAQAGHFPPALIRSGRTRSLARPHGVALGLTPEARYDEAYVNLRSGDLLVFYTDGMLNALDAADPVTELLRALGKAHQEGGAANLLERYLRPAEDEACVVTAELTA